MLKFKVPLKGAIPKLTQNDKFLCDMQNLSKYLSTIKSDMKQNEILTDTFKKQLKYIIERNQNPRKYQPNVKQHITSTSEPASELKNTSATVPIITDISQTPVENSVSEEDSLSVSLKKTSNPFMKISDLKKILLIKTDIIPVLLGKACDQQIVTETNQLSTQVDLASAVVPLSLHSGETSFQKGSAVQDIYNMYNKTSDKMGYWYLMMQTHSYKLDTFLKQPGTSQNFERPQVMCQAKEPPAEKKTEKPIVAEETPFDKIKKTIENILSSVKQKLEEMKKKAQENKKENK